jgi:hypothetical protein
MTQLGGIRTLAIALLAACTLNSNAWAQEDKCAMVPDGMRARCEEAMRVKQACAGLNGEALKACQQKNVNYGATREDCGSLTGDSKAHCLQHNRSAELAAPCSGKAGAELEECAKTQGAKAH